MRGKGTKLSEGCPKVRLSQDRLTILGHFPEIPKIILKNLGFSPFSGFGIITFWIITLGKSSWRQKKVFLVPGLKFTILPMLTISVYQYVF